MNANRLPSPNINDYGVIGNLHTAALISCHGSLDFLSLPRFDSPTAFLRLLDEKKGGHWSIMAQEKGCKTIQHYEPSSAILVTRHLHSVGSVEVTDFMPPVQDVRHCQIARRVRGLIGTTTMNVEVVATLDYGTRKANFDRAAGTCEFPEIEFDHDGDTYTLYGFSTSGLESASTPKETFEISAGDNDRWFLLTSKDCPQPAEDLAGFCESLLDYTAGFWEDWTNKLTYTGVFRDLVERSAITLKLLTSAQFGSSVAAVTFSLPELVGGSLNWDYRYTWIRDSAFTMYAMLRLGLTDEAKQFIDWIQDRCEALKDASDLGLMYRVDGGTDLEESELSHLAGYKDSQPVRIGNGAAGQRQLDIYGELIDTVYLYDRFGQEITYEFWTNLLVIIEHVCDTWKQPDSGIWEARGEMYQYTMSKVLAWVAIDRAIRIAQHRGFPAPLSKWFEERDKIYKHIYTEHFNDDLEAWTQRPGHEKMDGSVLLMPLLRFVTVEEPKWQSTLKRIEEILVRDALVARYLPEEEPEDWVPKALIGGEGYFTMCSMWYIEVLAKSGRVLEARKHLSTIASHANHLGLFSEEIGAKGQQIGNFPQAFTHLGFISAAMQIEEQLSENRGAKGGPKG